MIKIMHCTELWIIKPQLFSDKVEVLPVVMQVDVGLILELTLNCLCMLCLNR